MTISHPRCSGESDTDRLAMEACNALQCQNTVVELLRDAEELLWQHTASRSVTLYWPADLEVENPQHRNS